MERLIAPNGSEIQASEESVAGLLAMGFSRPEPEPQPKKAAPRKRTAKPKEQ